MKPGCALALLIGAALTGWPAEAQKAARADTLLKGFEQRPWNDYFTLAAALYREGRREEAAIWLYIAQIRAQAQIRCHQDRGGAQVRGALNDVVGRNINEYLYGSISRSVRVIDAALEWDAAHPNPRLEMPKCRDALETARADKREQREWTLANADAIRKGRSENGLPNETE